MRENMKRIKRRGRNFQWTHQFFIFLALWTAFAITMGLAKRSKQRQSENLHPTFSRQTPPLSSNSRGSPRDRLYYYNPQVYSSDTNSNNNNNRPGQSDNLRKSAFDTDFPSMYRSGTSSSSSSSVQSSLPTYSTNLESNKLVSVGRSSSSRYNYSSNTNVNSNGNIKKQRKKSYPPRAASVNSILRLDPEYSIWDEATEVCRTVPGLTKEQMELCRKNPEATRVALQGLSMAVDECAYQMSKNRWNCSSLQGRLNPHSTVLFNKGYRESAFGHAIAAAGVAYSVAKACSQGNLLSCGCGFQYDDEVNVIPTNYGLGESSDTRWTGGGNRNSISSWKWSGCSHNMEYGVKFSKLFLDAREKSSDLPSRINLHNNRVGRATVSSNMQIKCKCHGLSGSCELRTCWRSSPDFRQVGQVLKNKFRRAVMIDQSELGNQPLNRVQNLKKARRKRRDRSKRNTGGNIDLWYYERSPTYCESNSDFSIPGTTGRICNKTGGREPGSCSILCCGRGYNTIRQVYNYKCKCSFRWCCEVTCEECRKTEIEYRCK